MWFQLLFSSYFSRKRGRLVSSNGVFDLLTPLDFVPRDAFRLMIDRWVNPAYSWLDLRVFHFN